MQSQSRNTVLFILSILVLYGGYGRLRNQLWPPPPPKPAEDPVWAYDRQPPRAQAEIPPRLTAAPAGTALADAFPLAYQYGVTRDHVTQYPAAVAPPKPKTVAPPKLGPPPPETALGGEDYYLRV